VGGVLPRISIGTWGLCDRERVLFIGTQFSNLCTAVDTSMSDSCLPGQVRFGGGVLLFILGSSLGGVGPVRGLRGGRRGGWCEEWARSC
jgi:hypothetical protein